MAEDLEMMKISVERFEANGGLSFVLGQQSGINRAANEVVELASEAFIQDERDLAVWLMDILAPLFRKKAEGLNGSISTAKERVEHFKQAEEELRSDQ